jgi:hypothetical protein
VGVRDKWEEGGGRDRERGGDLEGGGGERDGGREIDVWRESERERFEEWVYREGV